MGQFKIERGDWIKYRKLPDLTEVDFHLSQEEPPHHDYDESMGDAWQIALDSLKRAYADSKTCYVLFTHGQSTSRRGRTTSRSVVRGLMRSTDATPYIDRKRCIQHDSVFVAVIRKSKPKLAK